MIATKFKGFLKKILLAINPLYRKVNSTQGQLENIHALVNNNLDILNNAQKQLNNIQNIINYQFCNNDESYIHLDVPPIKIAGIHSLIETHNKSDIKILEIGSREVTGNNNFRHLFPEATYVGFDFYAGNNVNIIGDAHKLSTYFDKKEKFDLIFSAAVFEHFAMPWVVAMEIDKLIKIGGYVLTATHFSHSSHERPWNFFQFSDMGLRVLFSPAMGYECIEAGMGNPIVGRFSSLAHESMRNKPVTGLYSSAHCLCKKVNEVKDFEWDKINLSRVVGDAKYPVA